MFISEKDIKDVFIFSEAVDFRKGLFSLAALIGHEFGDSITGRNLFVFTNSKFNRVRIVYWDNSGFAMWVKILESDKFKWPKSTSEKEVVVDATELKLLLSGIDIQQQKPHKKSLPKTIY